MWNILLFSHIVISLLLVMFILLQKTNDDGLSGLSSGNNMGVMSATSTANFMTKTTIILAILFFVNSLILANLSSKKSNAIVDKIEKPSSEESQPLDLTIPIAK